jgi:hypothetical protein
MSAPSETDVHPRYHADTSRMDAMLAPAMDELGWNISLEESLKDTALKLWEIEAK